MRPFLARWWLILLCLTVLAAGYAGLLMSETAWVQNFIGRPRGIGCTLLLLPIWFCAIYAACERPSAMYRPALILILEILLLYSLPVASLHIVAPTKGDVPGAMPYEPFVALYCFMGWIFLNQLIATLWLLWWLIRSWRKI